MIACAALAVAAGLAACSASEPCSGSRPGVEVTLVFEPITAGLRPTWTGEGLLVVYQENNPQGNTQVEVTPTTLDVDGKATVVVAYPPHAESGPFFAKLTAYGAPQGGNWEGWADFQADPATCHRVELDVMFVGGGADDGGVPAPDAAP